MEQKEVRGTPDQPPRLQSDILSESAPPPDHHPDDDAFIGYSMNVLAREEVAAVEGHLATCGDCRERLQRLLAVSTEWETPEAQHRLDDLSARIIRSFDERQAVVSSPGLLTRIAQRLQTRVGPWQLSPLHAFASVAVLVVASGLFVSWRWFDQPAETNATARVAPEASATAAPAVDRVEQRADTTVPSQASPIEPLPNAPVATMPAGAAAPDSPDAVPTPVSVGEPAPDLALVPPPADSDLASSRARVTSSTPVVDARRDAASASVPQAAASAGLSPTPSSVDDVVALVNSGMPEARIIEALKQQGRTYRLAPADLLKLTQAGAGTAVITAMVTPGGNVAAAAPAGAAPAGTRTPYPPDLPGGAPSTKRRLAVAAFDYSTVMSWVQYWFNQPYNIGDGIRAMMTVRLAQSDGITMLEREKIDQVMREQDFAASNRVRQGTGARVGQLSGADVNLYGDIVVFGRDDTTKRKTAGAVVGRLFGGAVGGAVTGFSKEEKAVVGINLRLVDTETGEVIETVEVRGESSRASRDFSGVLGGAGAGGGAVAGGSSGMTSSNFQRTIIGEATLNAVAKAVEYLESRVPKLPAKPRLIEGRVATIAAGRATLAIGSTDGVLRGDRYEILQITGEIRDPVTREVIDVDATKVGELVVDNVRDRTATGAYGGMPLSTTLLNTAGRGYAARLMSR